MAIGDGRYSKSHPSVNPYVNYTYGSKEFKQQWEIMELREELLNKEAELWTWRGLCAIGAVLSFGIGFLVAGQNSH